MSADIADLIERLEGARDRLGDLAERPTNTLSERNRLYGKRAGVVLALSYAYEYARDGAR
jgi:hypothetical protein